MFFLKISQLLREFCNQLLPPIFIKIWRKICKKSDFKGNFSRYEDALRMCQNHYGEERTVENMLKKANTWKQTFPGTPQRDQLVVQLMAALWVCIMRKDPKNKLITIRILDFGGGLAKFYFALRPLLPNHVQLYWDICETPICSNKGNECLANDELHFFSELNEVKSNSYDIVLMSGVLQVLSNPEQVFASIERMNYRHLIVMRVPLIESVQDRLTIPNKHSLFPCWFFSISKWQKRFSINHKLLFEWTENYDIAVLDGNDIKYRGFLIEREPDIYASK